MINKLRIKELRELRKLESLKRTGEKLKEDVTKNIVTGITAAFGLVIALTWKDVVSEGINRLVTYTGLSQTEAFGFRIVAAIIITFISVVGIMLIAKFMGKSLKK